MGILDSVKSVLGNTAGDKQNELMSTVMNLVGGQSGGLNGFISQFNAKGLGDKVSSWVGTGANLPVSPDEIQNVLGSDQINKIASKLGMDTNAVTSQLSNLLPQVVDKLTPEGKVPEGNILSKGMDLLGGLFGKK
jgi:uncharacterized protein YidB (DUF937 family)